eukprot:UN00306
MNSFRERPKISSDICKAVEVFSSLVYTGVSCVVKRRLALCCQRISCMFLRKTVYYTKFKNDHTGLVLYYIC